MLLTPMSIRALDPAGLQQTRDRVVAAALASPVVAVRRHGRVRWERTLDPASATLAPALGERDAWVTLAPEASTRFAAPPRAVAPFRIETARLDRRTRRLVESAWTNVLSPALHAVADEDGMTLDERLARWEGVRRAGDAVASTALELIRAEDAVLDVQDVALAHAASRVRRELPDARILMHVHTPFAGVSMVERLPFMIASELFRGMLACDLIGFQATRDLAGFAQACSGFLGAYVRGDSIEWDGRTVRLGVFPPAIDAGVTRQQAAHVDHRILRIPDDETVVAWVGSLEPAANALVAVEAFAKLLDDDPAASGRVRLVLKVQPSRPDQAHHDALIALQRAVAALNAHRASGGWVPVALECSADTRPGLAALLRADVVLVNALAEGSALQLQRAAVLSRRDPAVVLSRTSAAYERFGDLVVAIDPVSAGDCARGLRSAIRLSSAARAARAEAIRDRVAAWTPEDWLRARLTALGGRRRRRAPAHATWYGPRAATRGAL